MMTFRLLIVSNTPLNMRERFGSVIFREVVNFYNVECPNGQENSVEFGEKSFTIEHDC